MKDINAVKEECKQEILASCIRPSTSRRFSCGDLLSDRTRPSDRLSSFVEESQVSGEESIYCDKDNANQTSCDHSPVKQQSRAEFIAKLEQTLSGRKDPQQHYLNIHQKPVKTETSEPRKLQNSEDNDQNDSVESVRQMLQNCGLINKVDFERLNQEHVTSVDGTLSSVCPTVSSVTMATTTATSSSSGKGCLSGGMLACIPARLTVDSDTRPEHNYTNVPPPLPPLPTTTSSSSSSSPRQHQVLSQCSTTTTNTTAACTTSNVTTTTTDVAATTSTFDPLQPLQYVDLHQYDGVVDEGYLYWVKYQTPPPPKPLSQTPPAPSQIRENTELDEDYVNLAVPKEMSQPAPKKGWHGYDNVCYPATSSVMNHVTRSNSVSASHRSSASSNASLSNGIAAGTAAVAPEQTNVDNRTDALKLEMDYQNIKNERKAAEADSNSASAACKKDSKKSRSWFKGGFLSYHGSLKRPKSKRASLAGIDMNKPQETWREEDTSNPPRRGRPSSANSSPSSSRGVHNLMLNSGRRERTSGHERRGPPPMEPPPVPPTNAHRNFSDHVYAVPLTRTVTPPPPPRSLLRTQSAPSNAALLHPSQSTISMESQHSDYIPMGPGNSRYSNLNGSVTGYVSGSVADSEESEQIFHQVNLPEKVGLSASFEMRSRNCSFSSTMSSGSSSVSAGLEDGYMDMNIPSNGHKKSHSSSGVSRSISQKGQNVSHQPPVFRSLSVREGAGTRPKLFHSRSLDNELDDEDDDSGDTYIPMNVGTASTAPEKSIKPFDNLVEVPMFLASKPPVKPRMHALVESPEKQSETSPEDSDNSTRSSRQSLFSRLLRRNSRSQSKSQETLGQNAEDEDYAQISESDMDPNLAEVPSRRSSLDFLGEPPLPPRGRERSMSFPSKPWGDTNLTDEQKQNGGSPGTVSLLSAVPPAPNSQNTQSSRSQPPPLPPLPRSAPTPPGLPIPPAIPPRTYKTTSEDDPESVYIHASLPFKLQQPLPTYSNTCNIALVDDGAQLEGTPGMVQTTAPVLPEKNAEHRRQASIPWSEGGGDGKEEKKEPEGRKTGSRKNSQNLIIQVPAQEPESEEVWINKTGKLDLLCFT